MSVKAGQAHSLSSTSTTVLVLSGSLQSAMADGWYGELEISAMCAPYLHRGKPVRRTERIVDTDFSIVAQFQSEYRGVAECYRLAFNRHKLGRLKYVIERSLTKTLARKYRISVPAVYRRYRAVLDTERGPRLTNPSAWTRPDRRPRAQLWPFAGSDNRAVDAETPWGAISRGWGLPRTGSTRAVKRRTVCMTAPAWAVRSLVPSVAYAVFPHSEDTEAEEFPVTPGSL